MMSVGSVYVLMGQQLVTCRSEEFVSIPDMESILVISCASLCVTMFFLKLEMLPISQLCFTAGTSSSCCGRFNRGHQTA